MSKTKEQIMEDEYKKLIMNWEKAYQQSPSIFKAAHSAMGEYGKQQVIDFQKWTNLNGWFWAPNQWRNYHGELDIKTTEELYDIFLQSQSQ